eukprot:CAMPEP_0114570090 /NCGR_PEP_ID=MMETSP0114-20121206/17004_1 /TAXON_ID=31324 /ORGANISM="Goniomonas sp, Strain m" /LENGTH=95 /DNA_ID=CAMNT_0001757073 /DNA_START=206 /DNA_END=493 /DNA_ORIENTATION=-
MAARPSAVSRTASVGCVPTPTAALPVHVALPDERSKQKWEADTTGVVSLQATNTSSAPGVHVVVVAGTAAATDTRVTLTPLTGVTTLTGSVTGIV